MIRVRITRTSDYNWEADETFDDMDAAIEHCLRKDMEIIIKRPWQEEHKKFDYIIELYDDWRE